MNDNMLLLYDNILLLYDNMLLLYGNITFHHMAHLFVVCVFSAQADYHNDRYENTKNFQMSPPPVTSAPPPRPIPHDEEPSR